MSAAGSAPRARPRSPAKRSWRRRLLRWSLFAAVLGFAALGVERALGWVFPYPAHLMVRPQTSTEVVAADGESLRVTAVDRAERCLWVSLDQMSPHLIHALIAAEDERFYGHSGVDVAAVVRAVGQNVAAGRVVSGASTLTMQLARLVEPHERNLSGKLVEMFRARQMERLWSKQEILTQYANRVPMGGVLRGFEAASRQWFGVSCDVLSPAQAAALVAMIPAPSRRSPERGAAELRAARDRVLGAMAASGMLDAEALLHARTQPLGMCRRPWPFLAPHAVEDELARRAPSGGRIPTTLNGSLQRRIEAMVKRVDVGRADGVAVVVVGLDGHLQAMVGSRDWHTSQLNAAACRRPVGSTLKPLIYALAVELGVLGLEDRVSDRPLVYSDWRPANFHSDLRGAMRMGDALATSRNLPAVDLLERVGLPPFVDLLRSLGLPTDPRGVHLDAALGTLSASPLELAHAWVRFVAQPEAHGLSRRSVDPILAALSERPLAAGMNSTRGGSIAWKSGTSSGRRDAWCVGVTEAHVTVVWRGTLDGRATPDLLGVDSAGRLLAEVVGSL